MAKRTRRKKKDASGELFGADSLGEVEAIPLHAATQERYLNYALSVITARALPDVRDGLKPVQRRILFTMGQQGIRHQSKHRKCAKVVGDVMGNYHPHGDSAIYEALVRMAQPFAMRVPLVDGSGNFGSMDGDGAAAMRYTECRLAEPSDQILAEIGERTVAWRPSYDGSKEEPVVLPSRIPNLLVNGSVGIAVGMATSLPPHNPLEIMKALLRLLDDRELSCAQLLRTVKGPDFPTYGRILNTKDELKAIYESGSGPIRLRATHELGETTRSTRSVIITSIPYGLDKSNLVERIAEIVVSRKLPQLLDVRDLSTDDVRIELELKKDAEVPKVLGYLYKHTTLQINYRVDLTVLLPTANEEVGRPERVGLRDLMLHFLDFRLEVVTRKLENELRQLEKRIHILEGFEIVFDALDEILKIIRASKGKADAAKSIMARFDLDAEQTDAILELKLYRLAQLEILVIQDELADKRKRAAKVRKLLKSESGRWGLVKEELEELAKAWGANPGFARRTIIEEAGDEPEFSEEDFIVDEDAMVVLTRDGWIKRQREIKDLAKTKTRKGDAIAACQAGSTKATMVFFSSHGAAYSTRIADIPATTGHGEPIHKRFRLADGETIVAAFSLDPRVVGDISGGADGDEPPKVHALAVTSDGYSLRFGLEAFLEPSTRSGRKYARPSKGSEVVGVSLVSGVETVIAVTANARAMLCGAAEVNFLAGAGKGVRLIKVAPEDRVLGFIASKGDRDLLTVETTRGSNRTVSTAKYEVSSRGGRGREILKQGGFTGIVWPPLEAPAPL